MMNAPLMGTLKWDLHHCSSRGSKIVGCQSLRFVKYSFLGTKHKGKRESQYQFDYPQSVNAGSLAAPWAARVQCTSFESPDCGPFVACMVKSVAS